MGRVKEWEELTICDNFLFQKVMQNQRLCKRLIEKLLHIRVKHITYPEAEKSIDVSATQKSVRLDLYVETDEGVILDIEMQTTDSADSELPKRTRYYQSMIDLDALSKGKDYEELKQSYVIFICTFDPFPGNDRKQYTFSCRCREQDGLELGDETAKMFLKEPLNKSLRASAGSFSDCRRQIPLDVAMLRLRGLFLDSRKNLSPDARIDLISDSLTRKAR